MDLASSSSIACSHKLVKSLGEALVLRRIRNTCRKFLTNDQRHIGFWRQILWYFFDYQRRLQSLRIYLFYNSKNEPVGYGALKRCPEGYSITECVSPKHRGQGYGKAILQTLTALGREERQNLIAEIWSENKQSVSLHERSGFVLQKKSTKMGKDLGIYCLKIQK